jgi:electron transfer flavoprotein alpha subunit
MSKNIFVVAEQRGGTIQKVGLELLSEAKKLAADLGQNVVGVIMGSEIADLASSLFKYGADKVILIDHPILKEYVTEPYAKALTTLINEYDPEIMLFGATSIGRDLAPRVASRIHTGLTADCTGLKIDPDTKLLHMTRPAFGGNIMATIVCKEYRPQMATVRPGVMSVLKSENAVSGEVIKLNVGFIPEDMNVEILKIEKNTRKSVDITEAKVLVSGGRGVSGPNGFAPLRELADVLHGEVSASRVCVDNGWAEAGRQVGQTGKTVRPKLYIACGISGAIQHVAGMENSDFIIAINKDKDSPMMNLADLAVEGDISKILPLLTEEIKRRKSASPAG